VTGILDWSDAALVDPARGFGLIHRDLGRAALDAALAAYERQSDAAGLRERARFYACCALLEDLAYGLERDDARYVEKSLAALALRLLIPAAGRWIRAPPRIAMYTNVRRNTMTIQRALVIGAGSGVGRATADALTAAGVHVVAAGRERDATDPAQVAALLAEADPDLVVVAAGTRPRMAPIEEQSWESFSMPWNVDVKIAFEVGRAALARPLRPDSTVVIVSSGAAVNPGGSPLSGGYAGAKRMQIFLAGYLQRAADARELGIRFVALAPRQLLVGTRIGEAAAAAYGTDTRNSWPVALDPAGVARAIVSVAAREEHREATLLAVTGAGLEEI
jgi:NADP-dependent 3-hydroxy acid dehydrogenase YdfG